MIRNSLLLCFFFPFLSHPCFYYCVSSSYFVAPTHTYKGMRLIGKIKGCGWGTNENTILYQYEIMPSYLFLSFFIINQISYSLLYNIVPINKEYTRNLGRRVNWERKRTQRQQSVCDWFIPLSMSHPPTQLDEFPYQMKKEHNEMSFLIKWKRRRRIRL